MRGVAVWVGLVRTLVDVFWFVSSWFARQLGRVVKAMDLKSIGETLVSSNLTAVVLCCLPLFLRLASPLLPPRLASPCALFLDALVLVFVVVVCTARVMCVCVFAL